MIERLRSIALEEQMIRLRQNDFWRGFEFSSARIWSEVFPSHPSDHGKAIACALMRRAHANLFGVPDMKPDEPALAEISDTIQRLYASAFKYLRISVKKPASKLALKNKWSMRTGLPYQGSSTGPAEIAAAVQHHQDMVGRSNEQLVTALRRLEGCTNMVIPDRILCPLPVEDLFGSEAEWARYANFEPLSGSAIRRTLQAVIGPHYDQHVFSGGFSFVKRVEPIQLALFVDTNSFMGQFSYRYEISSSSDGRRISPSLTLEGILGLGGGYWDSIAKTDANNFAESFLHVDETIRSILKQA